ncbi:MAG: uracil-DNA glycosylase [Calditrichaeota bacterium]|nr:MAG: uracil-DNA glycosylase [Calditrichota bacterium]
MNDELRNKIIAYLEWYRDLYGEPPAFPELRAEATSLMAGTADKRQEKERILQAFSQSIRNCTRCRLAKGRTQVVFGVGNPDADIMFIGEAPGRDEDRLGEPFVGRAGQLLNKMLDHIQIRREDVYIANIIKCRPPNNRDPQPDEVAQCLPYLLRQIEIIQPRLLVALGRIAAQTLLGTKLSLGQMRARDWSYQGVPMIVTYHPAAILRRMDMLSTALEDFRKIKALSQKLASGEAG